MLLTAAPVLAPYHARACFDRKCQADIDLYALIKDTRACVCKDAHVQECSVLNTARALTKTCSRLHVCL